MPEETKRGTKGGKGRAARFEDKIGRRPGMEEAALPNAVGGSNYPHNHGPLEAEGVGEGICRQGHSLELEFITLGLHIGQVSKSIGKLKFTFCYCLTYIERRPPNQLSTLYKLWPVHLSQIVSYFCISKESNSFHRLRGVGTVLSPLFPAYCATHFRAISVSFSFGHLPFLYTFPSM